MPFARGDRVLIDFDGQTVEGQVLIASDNGRSLGLGFEAILGGYVGAMMVLDDGEGFRDLIQQLPVGVRPA